MTTPMGFLREVLTQFRQIFHPLKLHQQPSQTKTTNKKVKLDLILKQEIDLSNPLHVKYMNDLKRSYSDGVKESDAEGNETDRALSSQLILITTVLLTANIVVLGNRELLLDLTYAQKGLLIIGVGCLIVSLLSGVKYYQAVRDFHRVWSDSRQDVVSDITDAKFATFGDLKRYVGEITNKLNAHIDDRLLRRQISLLKVALTGYFVFVVILLFDFRFVTNSISWYR